MNLSKLVSGLAFASLAAMVAADDTPAPAPAAGGPIYYGRPNNGGYPYTTAPPRSENATAAPGYVYNGRPNNGGYPMNHRPNEGYPVHDAPTPKTEA